MDFRPNKKRILFFASTGCLLLILAFLPITLPVTVDATGKLIPYREWVISGNTDGRITSIVYDHLSGRTQLYYSSLFERGDAVRISFEDDIRVGVNVQETDTIGRIFSVNQERDFVQLQGFLSERRREMDFFRSGEKNALQDQAAEQLAAARVQAEFQRSLAQRKYELFQKQLISSEEYEIEKSKADLYQRNVAAAEATLRVVQSGAKDEQLRLISAQIEALETETDIIRQRSDQSWLISPITGAVTRYFSTDTLLLIQDRSEYLVLIPVLWNDRGRLKKDFAIRMNPLNSTQTYSGIIVEIDDHAIMLNGRQSCLVIASVQDSAASLSPGLVVDVRIIRGHVSPVQYVLNLIKTIING